MLKIVEALTIYKLNILSTAPCRAGSIASVYKCPQNHKSGLASEKFPQASKTMAADAFIGSFATISNSKKSSLKDFISVHTKYTKSLCETGYMLTPEHIKGNFSKSLYVKQKIKKRGEVPQFMYYRCSLSRKLEVNLLLRNNSLDGRG